MYIRKMNAVILTAALMMNTGCAVIETAPGQENDPVMQTEAPAEQPAEAPTEAPTEPPTEPPPSAAELKLADMDLHSKVCQMFIVTPEQLSGYDSVTVCDEWMQECYDAYPVGGFILFDQNVADADQLKALNKGLMELTGDIGAFISVDEEGGSISRVQWKLSSEPVGDMAVYGELNDRDEAFMAGAAIGSDLRKYGFNLDFAPVADVNINPDNELGSRIFSTDPEIVSEMSAAVSDGLHSAGICSTLKHFPGLGAGGANTHYGSVWMDRSFEELKETEFKAFKGGIEAGADFMLIGHQIVSGAGDELPADLSHKVTTDWLRDELGFRGLAITDSHSMGAIAYNYSAGEAAVMAVEAGIDVILMPYDTADAVNGVEEAVRSGKISEERIDDSVLRILQKKDKMGLLK